MELSKLRLLLQLLDRILVQPSMCRYSMTWAPKFHHPSYKAARGDAGNVRIRDSTASDATGVS